jgi:hypothetical protein
MSDDSDTASMRRPVRISRNNRGWPGNEALQQGRYTCASTDPLVAALFAIECQRHGSAVVHAVSFDSVKDLIGPPNYFLAIECAVKFNMSPLEFERRATVSLSVDAVRRVLNDMGFYLPAWIVDKRTLAEAVYDSHEQGNRLDAGQLNEFQVRIGRVVP